MRAADFIVRSLEAHGVARVYCVPGESYLALLDALYGSAIEVIVCRHEGGAGFMAVAEAKMTGKPAVFLVSRGPGSTNGSIAIHMAEQDGVPVIMLIGQVSREERTRAVFQEVDYGQFFGGMAKGVFEVNEGNKLNELMPRAFRLAAEGVPGPVILSLPEDMLRDEVSRSDCLVYPIAKASTAASDIAKLQELIGRAERPLVIAGSVMRGKAGAEALRRFANAQRIPVAVTWKNQDIFDNSSDLYAGHLNFGTLASQRKVLAEADLIIAVGTRLGDVASLGFTLPEAPQPHQVLVHVYPDGKPIGRVFRTDFGMIADPIALLEGLSQTARVVSAVRERWVSAVNGVTRDSQVFTSVNPQDGVDFGVVTMALAKLALPDTIITMDAGNMTTWAHRHWQMTPQNLLLGGIVGAMGFGVPSVVAAQLVSPTRMALCFVGDGGALMTGQELATAMAYGLKPKIVISDNGIYGTIRSHQERHYPERVSGTNLRNPDFAAWARSFGAEAFTLDQNEDVEETVAAFLKCNAAAVLHVKSSRIALSANGVLKRGV
jgi:acetolactate synthase I/II/III large subunit